MSTYYGNQGGTQPQYAQYTATQSQPSQQQQQIEGMVSVVPSYATQTGAPGAQGGMKKP